MMTAIIPFLKFLIEHGDIIGAVYDAIDGGLSKEEVLAGIKAAQVAAADAAVKADLGRDP